MRAGALLRLAWTVTVGAAYVWPLDWPAAPTSTFGEYRSRHFHGGIDLSTGESIGLPVRALDACEVERVRTSGVGYGRALYVRLADGRTAVYGHLDGFAPEVERWVAQVQDSTGQYEQDLAPPAGRFRFVGGEVVAYAGGSGAGPPHLHVELRAGDTGLNPLTQGLAVADLVAPTLAALWVYPATAEARVEGGSDPVRVALLPAGGQARAARGVRVQGPVRVAVEGFDRTEAKPNRLALCSLSATLDGKPAYEARFDSVSWLSAFEVEAVFDPRARARGADDAYALTPPAGLQCLALRRSEPLWWQSPAGRHVLAITAADAAGNEARAEAMLEWLEQGATASEAAPAGGRRRTGARKRAGARRPADLLGVEYFPDGLVVRTGRAGAVPGADLPAAAAEGGGGSARSFRLAEGFLGRVHVVATTGADTLAARDLMVAQVESGWTRTVRSADGALEVDFEGGSLFEREAVGMEVLGSARPGGAGGGLEGRSPLYRVEPGWLPVREPITVRLALGAGASVDRTGLFELGSEGRRFVGGPDPEAPGTVAGKVHELGDFFAARDTLAPVVSGPRVVRARRAALPGARPSPLEVHWHAADAGAGLDPETARLEIDGRRVAVELDPEIGGYCWRPLAPPSRGGHTYRIEAVDRLGNRAARAGTFRIR